MKVNWDGIKMECVLRIPKKVEAKYTALAKKLVDGNSEGMTVTTNSEKFYDASDHITLTVEEVFIGFIPKTWLVPFEEDV